MPDYTCVETHGGSYLVYLGEDRLDPQGVCEMLNEHPALLAVVREIEWSDELNGVSYDRDRLRKALAALDDV